jgi:hypothetical protein
MTYLSQPWFNREIVNRFAMATGVVHSETLTVIKRATKQPQKIPVTPVEVDGLTDAAGVVLHDRPEAERAGD